MIPFWGYTQSFYIELDENLTTYQKLSLKNVELVDLNVSFTKKGQFYLIERQNLEKISSDTITIQLNYSSIILNIDLDTRFLSCEKVNFRITRKEDYYLFVAITKPEECFYSDTKHYGAFVYPKII